jgi:hypothetical protein
MDPETVVARLRESMGLILVNPSRLKDGRSKVIRYQVASGSDQPSVVVKIGDPGSVTFRRELAAYRVLPNLRGPFRTPRLWGAEPEHGVLVLEDVAQTTPLLDLLVGDDGVAARASLGRMSYALGALHSAGRSFRDRLTLQLGAREPAFHEQAADFERAIPGIHGFVAALDIPVPEAFDQALERLSRRIADGGRDTTVTIGDIAPTNVLVTSNEVVFLDFEYSGVRHPFYDAMFWRCICPFPADVCDAMERNYRRGLTDAGWPFDNDEFDRAMLDAASHRLFWTLGWASTANLLENDRRLPPTRALLIHYIAEFLRLAGGRPHDPALVAMSEACLRGLLSRWDQRPSDAAFPVFARSSAIGRPSEVG